MSRRAHERWFPATPSYLCRNSCSRRPQITVARNPRCKAVTNRIGTRWIQSIGIAPTQMTRREIRRQGLHMPITHVIYQWVGPFYCGPGGGGGESNTAPWTFDVDLPPSSVYAFSNLSTYASRQNGQAGASTGILSYVTQDPSTGIPSQPNVLSPSPGFTVSGRGGPFGNLEEDFEEGLVPCFYDDNVIIITFAYNCFADNWVSAWASFTVFIFE